ncbi:MAG: hypothetical protein JNK15_13515 [Planctomycetes bacterium]|nr:hypothetical protein [Planctomycetota bacterium]
MRHLSVAVLAALPVSAQAGNETIFVGTSTSGSTDLHACVASGPGSLVWQSPSPFTNNVTDAVWADQGRRIYVGQSLGNQVSVADWNGATPTWSAFYAAPGACYGLGLDAGRQRLWVLTGASTSSRQLHCLDADLGSPGYGTLLASTNLASASRERWELSPSGNLAAVPHVFINTGLFELVDTNPSSPTFLQTLVSTPVPGAASSGFAFVSACEISIDDAYAYVLYAGLGSGALAVFDIATSAWLDFDPAPGQQDMAVGVSVPNGLALAPDRSFALVAGGGSTTGVARVDFDYGIPANTTVTLFAAVVAPNCNGLSLSPEATRACVTSTPASVSPPGTLIVFDVTSGGVLHTVPLGAMWNIYTTAWQAESPTATFDAFGVGCTGSSGVPVLAAATGSRPALGTTFVTEVSNLPYGIAVLQIGFSNTLTSTNVPLPLDLTILGMPGCNLLVDPLAAFVLSGPGSTASWSWALPGGQSLFGATFFAQAFSLDPAANAFGFAASNGGAGKLGY